MAHQFSCSFSLDSLPITDSCGSWQGAPQWEDDSRNPLNAEQIDEVGNWAASNPAYELFCVQAEVHHQRNDRSPSPDNTEAQVPDISSEAANDEDSDSLVNVNFHLVYSARSKLILRLAFAGWHRRQFGRSYGFRPGKLHAARGRL